MSRARDFAVSAVGLFLLMPIFLLIALMIRLDSPGPVFFRQTRVGLYGRPFLIHKFRTMRVGAAGPAVSTATDSRITRVGMFLRRTKLDELPQLIDVLHGAMSLVGPRPEVPHYVSLWPDDLRPIILSVRPGITDPVTVGLRSEADILAQSPDPELTYVEELLPLKAQAYIEYIRTQSFWGDIRTILATFVAVIFPVHSAWLSEGLKQ
ncbi:sugar transferase [Raineyella sp. W15-4]|uniref:sugar transferase n=1 Tax=Raineyella sp. W15-4 TaxID=3081651 RepID=UPI002953503D|nr:sugar transferase [Raineyella sp. W15-4]WOQ16972.1 sugar transferase [Raineyella sp. W15-4]